MQLRFVKVKILLNSAFNVLNVFSPSAMMLIPPVPGLFEGKM